MGDLNKQDTMSVIPMDPDGDLTLKVGADIEGQHETRFLVCSSTLRRSSLVFKKMLFGPWADSKPESGEWVVALPEDMPCTTETVLAAIHGRFDLVPQSWDLLSLEKIITLVDKYDMTHVLRPWSKTIKDCITPSVADPKLRVAIIHVAWGIGVQEAFVSTVKEVIFAASMTEDGQLELVGETERLNLYTLESFGPLDMADTITNTRTALIQAILDYFHGKLSRLANAESPVCKAFKPTGTNGHTCCAKNRQYYTQKVYCHGCSQHHETEIMPPRACDNIILGSIWRQLLLQKPGHGNLPTVASDFLGSAEGLLQTLSKLFGELECPSSHQGCSPLSEFEAFVKATREDERWTEGWQTEFHRSQLKKQRDKVGL